MSKYTYELREVVSTFGRDEVKRWFSDYELSDYLSEEEIAVINQKGIWNKDTLAERIIDHYYTREIGTNAIGQFQLFIKDLMKEIMETYAPIIYSTSIKFEPLDNMNITETYSGVTDNTATSTNNTNNTGLNIQSDTPQGQINKNEILEGKYASSTSSNESNSNDSNNSSSNGTQNYTRTTKGNSGTSQMNLLAQYRNIIRAVNTEIIYELEPLFMGIY